MLPFLWSVEKRLLISNQQARMLGRHAGAANITYTDGYAEWVQTNKTWRSQTDNDWRRGSDAALIP